MGRGIWMKTDHTGTRLGKHPDQGINGLYHQVHVDRRLDTEISQRFTDHGPDRQVWHVMVVHHVKVHPVGTIIEYLLYLFAQSGEIRGKNRGCNHEGLHSINSLCVGRYGNA